jgi:hypothetical protein
MSLGLTYRPLDERPTFLIDGTRDVIYGRSGECRLQLPTRPHAFDDSLDILERRERRKGTNISQVLGCQLGMDTRYGHVRATFFVLR